MDAESPLPRPAKERRAAINWNVILLAIIAATPPTIIASAAFFKADAAREQSKETHDAVNSRMTEMLILVKKQATDAATLDEKKAQQSREAQAALARETPAPSTPKKP